MSILTKLGIDYTVDEQRRVRIFEVNGSRSGFMGAISLDPALLGNLEVKLRDFLAKKDPYLLRKLRRESEASTVPLPQLPDSEGFLDGLLAKKARAGLTIPGENRILSRTIDVGCYDSEGISFCLNQFRGGIKRSTWANTFKKYPFVVIKADEGYQGRDVHIAPFEDKSANTGVIAAMSGYQRVVLQVFCPSELVQNPQTERLHAWSGRYLQWVYIGNDGKITSVMDLAYRRLAPAPFDFQPHKPLVRDQVIANFCGVTPAIPVAEDFAPPTTRRNLQEIGLRVAYNALRHRAAILGFIKFIELMESKRSDKYPTGSTFQPE